MEILFKCILNKYIWFIYFYILADTVFSESHSNQMIKCLSDNPCADRRKIYLNAGLKLNQTDFKNPHHLVWIKYTYAEIIDVGYFVF